MNIKKIAVLTSGGDSPGMNTALRAVVRTCAYNKIDCVGVSRGFQGLINDDIKTLKTRSVRGIINRGGTMLYSARSDEFRTKEGREKAFENVKKHNIDGIVVIGGDGSFTGGLIFQKEFDIPVIGIPGTPGGMTGPLPSSIGSLLKLETLILSGHSFSGEIPAESNTKKPVKTNNVLYGLTYFITLIKRLMSKAFPLIDLSFCSLILSFLLGTQCLKGKAHEPERKVLLRFDFSLQ